MRRDKAASSPAKLPDALDLDLRRMNPWWHGEPQKPLPTSRRHLVATIHRRLEMRLAPIVVVRGPRQIGKTTAQQQVIEDLLTRGVPPTHIFAVQFDDLPGIRSARYAAPILGLVDWYEKSVLRKTLNAAARDGQAVYLIFDEVQNLSSWAPQLKSLVDHAQVQVLVTGSSALRIEAGRDSLAGRITTLEAGVLSLTEIAPFHGLDLGQPFLKDNGLDALKDIEFWVKLRKHGLSVKETRDRVFAEFSSRGGYPMAHSGKNVPWNLIADQLNENVIRRVIRHDLRTGDRGRKRDPDLLEATFRLACRYAGQTPRPQAMVQEIRQVLSGNVGVQRIQHYLQFLEDALLIRRVNPAEIRLKRRRAPPKICLADHGLRASWLQEIVPLVPAQLKRNVAASTVAGRIAESVVGSVLLGIPGLDVAYLPERKNTREIDFILTVGMSRIPLEVKYQQSIDPDRDTAGLRTFIENGQNQAPFGILVVQSDEQTFIHEKIVALPLSTLLLLR